MNDQQDAQEQRHDSLDVTELYADLGGVTEIAEHLHVSVHRVRRWIERRDSTHCPVPVKALKFGHIYSLREWQGWFALWKITRGSETWLQPKKKQVIDE